MNPVRVGVIGASGFTGTELLRLIDGHDQLKLVFATGSSKAGSKVADLYPSLAAAYPDLSYIDVADVDLDSVDLAFIGLPHGKSQDLMRDLRGKVAHIVDLAADFRLHDASLYPTWYGEEHKAPELLAEFVYGMPELFRDKLGGAELIAAPGCNVTTAALSLAPLVSAGLVEPTGIIVNVLAGVSGAGRPPKEHTTFCTVDENLTAYGVLTHRHTPEIDMALSAASGSDVQVIFTPHLVPLSRGILATSYARPTGALTTDDALNAIAEAYEGEPFVVVSERLPESKATLGSNSIHITARVDERTGWVIAFGALDNLVKGASGQALQCANLALGLEETAGLTAVGLYP